VLAIIGREVRAAAAEANPQRTPGNDHRAGPSGGQYAFAEIIFKSYAKRLLQVERNSPAPARHSTSKSTKRVLLELPAESTARNFKR
jgi:hypothetical protein